MTVYLLAGGGTAGHVNPLLAVADELRAREPGSTILVLGTREGLESRLVPARGYELLTIARLPFPRRPDGAAVRFAPAFARAVGQIRRMVAERGIDVVVGFGGYAAAPAYVAARRSGVPVVVHEANASPGLANRLGARVAAAVGITFPGTALGPRAEVVGMPLRREIATLDRAAVRDAARAELGLDADRPTLLVTGGSTGARSLNRTVVQVAERITATGAQILHIVGGAQEFTDPGVERYHVVGYSDRMELAIAAADLVVSRAGAGALSELTAVGVPAVYVPYPVGNGEQAVNVRGVVAAGGGIVLADADFTPDWVLAHVLPLLSDPAALARMSQAAASVGTRDGAARMADLVRDAVAARPSRPAARR
ncbi:undecaprenyldiphospho-muramoylpentapeptide beta-N-acetylglucosaminyltransferase [Clavibacter michiganensis]|uniref:undecaprenyldiphospho-muramoylpentapeptide beta-N-acetylglucosaminyltransferase n=1 Tax=Clavibacter michiganensis TaxID=28447 RepID=UPI0026DABBB0|nr:undecaprenyldiphospho-muramoylpentapeptide beta-N-acetylglucosaminyltransferase [Clavibacter michiganensis]MDO4144230.1 undecaprenyldiphospho-muramoylpentapeptide beta-N-acetylglucosaminyltransferase [Clavibacter michiganensis]